MNMGEYADMALAEEMSDMSQYWREVHKENNRKAWTWFGLPLILILVIVGICYLVRTIH